MSGSYIHTLVATDICSEWVECDPLLSREQSLVVKGIEAISSQLPFEIKGIDSDNDSAFINDTLINFCDANKIRFTRSRACHKNDQAWIEQKNGAVVRRTVGYDRLSGAVAGHALAHLYHALRLHVKFFQPSHKLRQKERRGAKVKRLYYPPATLCDRILSHSAIDDLTKEKLKNQRRQLDPIALLHRIRENQSALAALISKNKSNEGPGRKSLEQFHSQLPMMWRSGEVRPTHRSNYPLWLHKNGC